MTHTRTPFVFLQALLISVALAFASAAGAAEVPTTGNTVQQQVDINTADAATLAEVLDGVGMVKAQAIIDYREQFGKFQSVDQLLDVQGIGAATLEKNRHMIMTGPALAD